MPTYVYRKKDGEKGCEVCTDGFETTQPMSDDALEKCPRCGSAIERIITGVNIGKSNKALLSDKNLKGHGFTKLVNEGGGHFRETTGNGHLGSPQ